MKIIISFSGMQELAEKVIAEQLKTVQYKSTDNVMKHSSFVELCRRAIGSESPANVSVVELWLLKEKKIAKAMWGNRDVIKFCEKREAITNTDREILRYIIVCNIIVTKFHIL